MQALNRGWIMPCSYLKDGVTVVVSAALMALGHPVTVPTFSPETYWGY